MPYRHALCALCLYVMTLPGVAASATEEWMKDGLSAAYMNHPDVLACKADVEASEQERRAAFANFLPTADAQWTKGRRKIGGLGESGFEDRSYTASLPVFRGGSSYHEFKRANKSLDAQINLCLLAEQNALIEAIESYLEVYYRRSLEKYRRANVKSMKTQADRAARLKANGLATASDFLTADAERARAESQRIEAGGEVADALDALFRITGVRPEETPLPSVPTDPIDAQEAEKQMLAQSFELKALELATEAAESSAKAGFGALLPSASVNASHILQKNSLFFPGDLESDEIALTVNIPLFRGGATYANYRKREHMAESAGYDVKVAERRLKNDLSLRINRFRAAKEALAASNAGVKAAKRSLEGVEREHNNGLRTALEVIEAKKTLLDLQSVVALYEKDMASARYRIMALTGELTPEKIGLQSDGFNEE